MADKYTITTIVDVTAAIAETDNFLSDLQEDSDIALDTKELARRRKELDAVLKFFNAEG